LNAYSFGLNETSENSITLHRARRALRRIARVKHGIYVSRLKYAPIFDHRAVVSGIARTYSQRGIAVKSEPSLPGGKHADLAVSIGNAWTYIEVKTRAHGISRRRRSLSYRQDLLREILRLRAHSLKQLPKKEASLVVLSTSLSPTRKKAIGKIALARSFTKRIFDHNNEKILGLMIFAPYRASVNSAPGWEYASTLIPNPNLQPSDGLEELGSVQL
jgi:hypothetical protein